LTRFAHTAAGILAHSSIQVFSRSFRFCGCCWATWSFSSLHRFSIGFRSGDQDLEMLLTEPLLSCLCCVFGVIVMLEDTSHDPSSILLLREGGCWQNVSIHGPIHPALNTVQSAYLLCRKAPPKHDVSTPCFTVGMVFLGLYSSFFFLQTRRVKFTPKSNILVSSDHMTFSLASSGSSRWSLTNFRHVMAWTCAGLSRRDLARTAGF